MTNHNEFARSPKRLWRLFSREPAALIVVVAVDFAAISGGKKADRRGEVQVSRASRRVVSGVI